MDPRHLEPRRCRSRRPDVRQNWSSRAAGVRLDGAAQRVGARLPRPAPPRGWPRLSSGIMTAPITSLTDVLAISQKLRETQQGQLWWRGHGLEAWKLVPHVHRYYDITGPQYERNIATKFSNLAP